MIKSPLRYPGGKNKAIKTIAPIIPSFNEFREPFLGGGSLFIYLKQLYPKKKYWINDLYPNLFYFWEQTQKNVDILIKQVIKWKEQFQSGKELYNFLKKNIENFDKEKKATAFFIFNRITFSGTSESGGFSNSAHQKRFTNSSIERVKKLSTILNNTKITNLDYQEVIEQNGDNVFIFLDPPYHSSSKSALYGKNGNLHKYFDHKRLSNILKNTHHKWLITYDNSKYIRNIYSFANIQEWNLTYGMRNINKNRTQKEKELFISNYEFKIQQTLFDNNFIKSKENHG